MVSNTHWTNVWQARDGDAEALAFVCAKYRPVVLDYLRRSGLGADAEDVAQEAMIALLSALERVDRSAGRFRALVHAIARNKLLHHFRAARARNLESMDGRRDSGDLAEGIPTTLSRANSGELFDHAWIRTLVTRCLELLHNEEPELFESLNAIAIEGRSYPQLSRQLGVSQGALRKRVLRGRRRLAGLIEQEVWLYGETARDVDAELTYLHGMLERYLR